MTDCLCMDSIEKRVKIYGRICNRSLLVKPSTKLAFSYSNKDPFFAQLVIDHSNGRLVLQKPILETSDWTELFHGRSRFAVELQGNIIVKKDVIDVTDVSFRRVEKKFISARSPSGCVVKQVCEMRRAIFVALRLITQHNDITSAF